MPFTVPDALYQFAVPVSDIGVGGLDFVSTPWYPNISDGSDSTIIQSVDSFTVQYVFECGLSGTNDPLYDTNFIARIRAQKASGATNQAIVIDLRQSGTTIYSWGITLSTTPTTYEESIPSSAAALITSGGFAGGLSIRGTTQLPGGLTPNRVVVEDVKLGVPPVGFEHLIPGADGVSWSVAPVAGGSYVMPAASGFGWEWFDGVERAGCLIGFDGRSYTLKT
jgi:hypothetical protein